MKEIEISVYGTKDQFKKAYEPVDYDALRRTFRADILHNDEYREYIVDNIFLHQLQKHIWQMNETEQPAGWIDNVYRAEDTLDCFLDKLLENGSNFTEYINIKEWLKEDAVPICADDYEEDMYENHVSAELDIDRLMEDFTEFWYEETGLQPANDEEEKE